MSPRRIRITYVIDNLGYGGAQRQLALVASAMSAPDVGVDVSVVCLSDVTTPFGAVIKAAGVPLTTVARRTGADVSRLVALRRLLRGAHPDVVHAFSDSADVYAFMSSRGLGIPLVTSMRSDRMTLPGARARVLSFALRHCDAVVTNSRAGRDALVDGVGVRADRVHLVHNVVESDPAQPGHEVDARAARVGFVGRLVPLKRVDRLVDAFAGVAADNPHAELVLVGEGTERDSLSARVHGAGLDGRVTFAGTVEDARPLMRTFSCLVLPSRNEGLPNVVLEALAAGVPVVASPVGDIPHLIDEGRTGLLVADDSVNALTAAIARALGDEGLRRGARDEGPRFVREHFSATRAVDSLLELYRSFV